MIPGKDLESWRPLVAIVGTSDVDRRIDLMHALEPDFRTLAIGSSPALAKQFSNRGFGYASYKLTGWSDGLSAVAELTKVLRQLKPDVVHTFDTVPSIVGRLAALRAGVGVVVGTLPGLGRLYVHGAGLKAGLVRAGYEQLQRRVSRASSATIFQHRDDLNRFVSNGIVPGHSAHIVAGSGIRTGAFNRENVPEEDRQRVRRELSGTADGPLVVMVADVMRSKGVMEFAKAAADLKTRHPNVSFVLVGGASTWRQEYLSPAELQFVSSSVRHVGARTDVQTVLAAADIFVLPSYYAEGIPRVLLEAGAMELGIVTTDSPGCRAVIRDGKEGLLVPPRNAGALGAAIERMIVDETFRTDSGRAARKLIVDDFDLEVVAEATKAIYRNLLGRDRIDGQLHN